ncbi:hypothetical protein ART_3760 [Arthrobacter sp. PAMC 25486]|nr:hypothetical protein ART_3760 [Arthrobacter sp. PAMC 25486]
MQHYALRVDDGHFDRALVRPIEAQLEYWTNPQMTRSGETTTEHGGRGVYFRDPAGHGLELITQPYF